MATFLQAISALNLEEGIVTRWGAVGLDALVLGRSDDTADAVASALWKLEAPEDSTRPYVVFAVTGFAISSRDSGNDDTRIGSIHQATVRFNCYADDDATAGAMAKHVMNNFDNAAFALVTSPVGNARVTQFMRATDLADKVGENEWVHTVLYEVIVDSQQEKV